MNLKHTKKVIYEVEFRDLEKLITTFFGQAFEITADQEVGNDSSISMNHINGEKTNYSQNRVCDFVHTGAGSYLLRDLMNALAAANEINKGDYVIRVSW